MVFSVLQPPQEVGSIRVRNIKLKDDGISPVFVPSCTLSVANEAFRRHLKEEVQDPKVPALTFQFPSRGHSQEHPRRLWKPQRNTSESTILTKIYVPFRNLIQSWLHCLEKQLRYPPRLHRNASYTNTWPGSSVNETGVKAKKRIIELLVCQQERNGYKEKRRLDSDSFMFSREEQKQNKPSGL